MKSNNLLLLVLFVILLMIVGCVEPGSIDSGKVSDNKASIDNSNIQKSNFLLHEDTTYKVKILYPREWKLVETKDNIFAFQEPKLTADDKIQENLNLIMNDVSDQDLTFEKFKPLAMENLKQTVQDFSLIDSSSTTLADTIAQKNVFTAFNPKLKLLQVITLKNDITYAITFVSTPESFENYLPVVEKMLDSFEITGDIKEQEQEQQDKKEREKPVEKSDEKNKQLEVKAELKDGDKPKSPMTGTYRCWSYNVQGAGKSCTSPPIVLNKDGTYLMSSEKGTFAVDGDTIILSESKIRGPGKILEDGNQLRFEYDYNNWHHVITYLKTNWDAAVQENSQTNDGQASSQATKYVEVSLNIVFPESVSTSGINSASLVSKGETEIAGEALAYESKSHTVTALFRQTATKPGIPAGKIYTVQLSSGFGYWYAGEIDLRDVKDNIELTINYQPEKTQEKNTDTAQATTTQPTTTQPAQDSGSTSDQQQTQQPPANAPKCDPNIPKYSQPGCVE